MFDLADDWVWDFWLADDGQRFWMHFLHAPRSLGDPDLRHVHARVGQAVSDDLSGWTRCADPLPERRAGFDDRAQWTGCTLRHDDRWWLFTTGRTHADDAQRIGLAHSPDLREWRRTDLVLEADAHCYDVPQDDHVHWRDPWVLRADDGTWHLYVTARVGGPGSGVVGHATSRDLRTWQVAPPLSRDTGRFDWLEVISVVEVEGRWLLLFSCVSADMPGADDGAGGIWTVPVDGPGAPVDVDAAVRLTDESLYVGRLVQDRAGSWQLLAFRNVDTERGFLGGVTDPVPVRWRADGAGLEMSP